MLVFRQDSRARLQNEPRLSPFAVASLLILSVLMMSGCGGPKLAPVTGTVRLEGEPVGPGVILFQPDKNKGNEGKAAMGNFGSDGVYTLKTYEEGDGALVGHHKVIIRGFPPSGGDGDQVVGDRPIDNATRWAQEPEISRRYQNAQDPLLSAEVVVGGPPIDFDLER